jgi:cytochrome P450
MYVLAENPDVRDRVEASAGLCSFVVLKCVQAECGALQGVLSYSTLKNLPYTEHFIYEVLRLYPPVPSDPKQVVQDDVLPGGVQVYAGETGERTRGCRLWLTICQ